MSLTLVNVPMSAGNNLLSGFLKQEIDFIREDIDVISVTSGTDALALITVAGNITANLKVSEYVYLYSETTNLFYDLSAAVITITYSAPNTLILINTPYTQTGAGGYMNYYQNYFVEAALVSIYNDNYEILPFRLRADGNPAGLIKIDISAANDINVSDYALNTGGVLELSRNKFKVKYRQSWRESAAQAFTSISSPNNGEFIMVYSTMEIVNDTIINRLGLPKFYYGYPNSVIFAHTDYDFANKKVSAKFDELDLNRNTIISDNLIRNFDAFDFGHLAASTGDISLTLDSNTKFVKVHFDEVSVVDYQPIDYAAIDYKTT